MISGGEWGIGLLVRYHNQMRMTKIVHSFSPLSRDTFDRPVLTRYNNELKNVSSLIGRIFLIAPFFQKRSLKVM